MPADNSPGDLNLALIEMVQAARLQHDAAARPSDYAAVYWIEVKRPAGAAPGPTAHAGEWRAPLKAAALDAVWERVKAMTLAGKLGYKSKVSTGPAADQRAADARLLCARTYDARDQEDIQRVKAALLELGLGALQYVPD